MTEVDIVTQWNVNIEMMSNIDVATLLLNVPVTVVAHTLGLCVPVTPG